jgi:iron complex outermembrane receptor protein
LIGDGEFSSEHLLGYEAGYRRYFQRGGFLAVSTFFNRYDDLLSVESSPPVPETDTSSTRLILPLHLRNGVRAQTSGGEVSGLWDLRKWWRVTGSYSLALLDARNKPESNDASTVRQLEGDSSRHKVAAQSSFELPRRFELNLMFRHVSSVPNQGIPSYSTGDAWLAWRLHPRLELSVVGRNLLQPSHVEYRENPGPLAAIRRSAYVKMTWTR